MSLDAFYSTDELRQAGFQTVGNHVRVSRKTSLYNVRGTIGNHVRIDDFCILKGRIEIGNHVHICAYCSISGVAGVVRFGDFSTLANRVSVYTGSDDYRADALSSSTVPADCLATITGDVTLGRAALIGAHSVILPGTSVGEGASVGAMCIVHGAIRSGTIAVAGNGGLCIKGTRNVDKILRLAEEVERRERESENKA
jgi:dTDP-4-amino-4,6-dideoxy-D-glucose acyltransferase